MNVNLREYNDELLRLSRLLDAGLEMLRDQAHVLAEAENAYRKGRSEAWFRCPNDLPGTKAADREWIAARREDWIAGETAELRKARDIAEGMKVAALEAVRSRKTQISSLQTLLNAYQEQARFDRTGPDVA